LWSDWRSCETIFDLPQRKVQIEEYEAMRLEPNYWDDPDKAQGIEKKLASEKTWVDAWSSLKSSSEDIGTLIEMAQEDPDSDLGEEINSELASLVKSLEELELKNMLQGVDDSRNAILTINPGAGGTESQDWAEMLLRMYNRYGDKNGFKVSLVELQPGEAAGIKSATLRFEGDFAFGYLKAESGVHRLVRISPFDSSGRRHTSFASVFVYPEIDNTIEIDINMDQVELQRFHSGGKGGQNVNKVETGVRLIWEGKLSNDEQTKVVAECTEERSQLQNREKALVLLKSKIYQLEREIQEAAKDELQKSKKKIEWGSQIRSYVFQPYTMVNDHRTEMKDSDVHSIMDGSLGEFIKAYLMTH